MLFDMCMPVGDIIWRYNLWYCSS